MIGLVFILLTAAALTRNSKKKEEKKNKSSQPTKPAYFTSFTSGYDPVRQVYWSQTDKAWINRD